MVPVSPEAAWQTYALAGRRDFLNYLHKGNVTWPEVWSFYRTYPADTDAVVRICGLFHMFESLAFDREGCVLDCDEGAYRSLREWSEFSVEAEAHLPALDFLIDQEGVEDCS